MKNTLLINIINLPGPSKLIHGQAGIPSQLRSGISNCLQPGCVRGSNRITETVRKQPAAAFGNEAGSITIFRWCPILVNYIHRITANPGKSFNISVRKAFLDCSGCFFQVSNFEGPWITASLAVVITVYVIDLPFPPNLNRLRPASPPICTPAFPTSFNFETSVDAMADFIPSVKTGPDPSASSSDLLLSSVNSPDAYDMVRGKLHKSANAFRSCFLNADFILEAASLIFSVPPVSALRNKQPRVFWMQHTQALRELRLQEPVYRW